ncbi:FAD-binding protein [Desulfofundulus thermobenzoicus]|uniref:FAD-binding protein n=1 Tax=Desulfofundulus thermobenzoicus TaxID=29376 RepID=A0A6N7IS55_9FIRM|nr:FAD-binding oxidoreductase [Desulfofundulus thermobenzoicus]MQL52882.1 FAD-binding protein [Desulfofundulus thermobenzoicus]HHW44951.1 FAD-binding protein [Desulfotomaculum sp.]
MRYNPVTPQIVEQLMSIVGEANVVLEPEKMEVYGRDETSEAMWQHMPEVVVKPENARQISEIIKLANREIIPVTPRGAGTGLAAGAVPMLGGILLSLERMNKILEVDRENLFMVTEPGVTTGEVQRTARAEGFLYAGDPCSAESSFIGGNVATNAGGNKAVKYGVTGRHIYGLEVVLPNGEIVTLGGKCVKDVTGYDLVHLIVGSEGTLGVVTKVYLKLMPLLPFVADLLVPFDSVEKAIKIVPTIMTHGGIIPTCLEFMDSMSIKAAELYLNQKLPYSDAAAYVIVEIDGNTERQVEEDYETIGKLCLENGGLEVFVADNPSAQDRIWKARKCYAEALRMISPVYCMEDIVVPVSQIPRALEAINGIAEKHRVKIPCVAHAGDGNIHATLLREDRDEHTWHEVKDRVLDEIYREVYALGGALSGEHGIGAKRKGAMARFLHPAQIDMIKSIKKALDPNLILNPDKLVDVL